MSRSARIVATGRHLPEQAVDNDELRARFAALDRPEVIDKLEAGSGIRCRWYTSDDRATSDLALPAARQALARAGRGAEEVDLILLGTDTPDYLTPATSTVLQAKLGAVNAGTFDIGCACASFPTALATAAGLIATNPALRTVLVVGAYLMHRLADPDDPTIFFYGDGAGAAVIEPAEAPGFIGAAFEADGRYAHHWGLYAGATAEPASVEAIAGGRTRVQLRERYPPEVNEAGWPRLFRRLAGQCGFEAADVAQVLFTQINRGSIERACAELGLSPERAHTVMADWGYTGSACIPMALDDAIGRGLVGPGDLVVMIGSGVGYNMAASAFRLDDALVVPEHGTPSDGLNVVSRSD